MRHGAHDRDPVAPSGSQVRRRREPHRPRGARRREGRFLVGAATAHLDEVAPAGGDDHAARGRRDGAVEVEDRQHQRLEQHGVDEGGRDAEHRRVRVPELTLGVGVDGAPEPVAGEVLATGRRQVTVGDEPGEVVVVEAEPLDGVEQASDAGDDAVLASRGKSPRRHLEGRRPVGDTAAERSVDHRELVQIGPHGRRARRGCGHYDNNYTGGAAKATSRRGRAGRAGALPAGSGSLPIRCGRCRAAFRGHSRRAAARRCRRTRRHGVVRWPSRWRR